MKAVGIITEYNPLHEGHIIHIDESRRISGADVVVCVMSGDYVQRGEPAIIDKFSRARMAVLSGVDLVVELPVQASLSSAEGFAEQSVKILESLGAGSLCFGCEDSDIEELSLIASVLADEPDDFKECIIKLTGKGESYASARQKAMELCVGHNTAAILEKPNNTLGIEYIKAIKRYNLNMNYYCIKRDGAGYNDETIKGNTVPSATAVRHAILEGKLDSIPLPLQTRRILKETATYPVVFNDFTSLFYYRIETLLNKARYDKETFADELITIKDVSKETAARIYNVYNRMIMGGTIYPLDEFALLIKTKQYALSRIKRIIMKIVLDIRDNDSCDYIRILGFSQIGREYLSAIKNDIGLPLISKVADYKNLYYQQIHVHDIYRQICISKFGKAPVSDYMYRPLITD